MEHLAIRRLGQQEIGEIQELMEDVISRLPSQELFAMDDEDYFLDHIKEKGIIFGAFYRNKLVAYSVLAFPEMSENNLGGEFGVPEEELSRVAVLDSTVVHETARGLGLQKYFNDWRENMARERGSLYLYSTVHPENRPSIRNLEASGLRLQFTRTMYGGKPRHCYAKRLF